MKTLTRLVVDACFVAPTLAEQTNQPPKPGPEHQKLALGFEEWTLWLTE